MRTNLCQYGNCENTNVAVRVNYKEQERPVFCCATHAGLWLLKRENYKDLTLSDLDRIQKAFP